MPSMRIISALAVAAVAGRPTKAFLAPTFSSTTSSNRRAGNGRAGETAIAAAAPRASYVLSSSSTRFHGSATSVAASRSRSRGSSGGGCLTMMMAKKKGKKKGAGKKAVGKQVAAAGARGGGGVAVAEDEAGAPSPAVAAAAAVEENAKMAAEGVIKNRAGSEKPVAISPPSKVTRLDAAAASVNGGPATPKAGSGVAGGATKGFGAPPPPQPRPMQKGLNRGSKPMTAQQGGRQAGAQPPPKQPGFDALATGVPVAGQTDHQKMLTDVEFTEPEPESDVVRLNKAARRPQQPNGEEMSPADMLQYLRDNSLTIDLETMNPVEMPTQPAAKMEAFFPYPAANTVAKYSLGAQPKPSQFADAIIALLPEDDPWDGQKIRELPELKEFLLANRVHGGNRGMNVITAMLLRAMSEGNLERAKYLKGAAICMTKAENAITGPFRQAVMFAENRLAPCMGSTVCEEYAGADAADAAATWVVLKACVAEWELRLREMRGEEIGLHDIFRTMPNPTMGLDEERTAAITGSVQAMGLSFSNNEKLMKGVSPVIRFMDGSLGLNTTTEVRRYALQEFCPEEGMAPEELRLRVRSFMAGLDQLPSKSYHQLQIATADVYQCLAEGTPDEYCLFMNNWEESLDGDENLSFQPYRLDTGEVWRNRLREIVTTPVPQREDKDDYEVLFKEILPKNLWNFVASDETDNFELPFVYLKEGWWDALDYLDKDRVAEKMAREAEAAASIVQDPDLRVGGEEEEGEEMDDIFTDLMKEEEAEMELFEFTEEDFEDYEDDTILDGPGPGMQELDLGFEGGSGDVDLGR